MDKDFWLKLWEDKFIPFHKLEPNEYLLRFIDRLNLKKGDQVFLPLCGKSLDILWLNQQSYSVLGIELSEIAINEFFQENKLQCEQSQQGPFISNQYDDINLLCGDFFQLTKDDLVNIKAVFDRGSFIALPRNMRKAYAELMCDALPTDTHVLLVTIEHPYEDIQGPPFAVNEKEVNDVFGRKFSIERLSAEERETKNPWLNDRGVTHVLDKAYLLKKTK